MWPCFQLSYYQNYLRMLYFLLLCSVLVFLSFSIFTVIATTDNCTFIDLHEADAIDIANDDDNDEKLVATKRPWRHVKHVYFQWFSSVCLFTVVSGQWQSVSQIVVEVGLWNLQSLWNESCARYKTSKTESNFSLQLVQSIFHLTHLHHHNTHLQHTCHQWANLYVYCV